MLIKMEFRRAQEFRTTKIQLKTKVAKAALGLGEERGQPQVKDAGGGKCLSPVNAGDLAPTMQRMQQDLASYTGFSGVDVPLSLKSLFLEPGKILTLQPL